MYRIPADAGLNPVKPWSLEILIESKNSSESRKYAVNYTLNEKYIIQPDGLIKIANKDTPIWYAAWENQKNNILIMIFTLMLLPLLL